MVGSYTHCWDLIKYDDMALIEKDPRCIRYLNSTTLVLLPNKENVEDITDLRPISLLNYSYKTVTKALDTRLSGHIDKLTNHSQSAFIPDRYIMDNS